MMLLCLRSVGTVHTEQFLLSLVQNMMQGHLTCLLQFQMQRLTRVLSLHHVVSKRSAYLCHILNQALDKTKIVL